MRGGTRRRIYYYSSSKTFRDLFMGAKMGGKKVYEWFGYDDAATVRHLKLDSMRKISRFRNARKLRRSRKQNNHINI